MARNLGAVLDFGSSKLTLLVGEKTVNNNFNILASSDLEYAGFMDGEFLEPNQLKADISKVLKDVDELLGREISRIFVGVPAEFCAVTSRGIEKNFFKLTKIKQTDIDELFISMDKNLENETHSIINVSPLCYELDGTNRTNNPVGALAKHLKAYACVVLAENKFLDLVNGILKDLGVEDIEYVCSALAVATTLIPMEDRSNGALVLDSGYLTTSISYAVGEGLFELATIPMGGGQITAEISDKLQLPFGVAEQVKRQLLITLKPTGLDYYEVVKNGKLDKVSTAKANDIALKKLDELVEEIKEKIDAIVGQGDTSTLYLTGGGLAYLKGISFYLENALGRKVEIIKPQQVKFACPDLSSVVSLLDTALKMEDN